ncbi:hypothetical protein MGH68_09930 [Erysipelothrix sp. D19-032]
MHALTTTHKNESDILMQRRISLAQLEPLLDVKRSKYERLKQEYEDLNPMMSQKCPKGKAMILSHNSTKLTWNVTNSPLTLH